MPSLHQHIDKVLYYFAFGKQHLEKLMPKDFFQVWYIKGEFVESIYEFLDSGGQKP